MSGDSTTRIVGGIEYYTIGDGRGEDSQCARCGSSTTWIDCWNCGGEGEVEDHDWGWFGEEEYVRCGHCHGTGGWEACCSGREWCQANPMPGREHIESTAMRAEDYD